MCQEGAFGFPIPSKKHWGFKFQSHEQYLIKKSVNPVLAVLKEVHYQQFSKQLQIQ